MTVSIVSSPAPPPADPGSIRPGQDLATCDREPIHAPGVIQPHGLLLVAETATLDVVAGAGLIEDRLTSDWLGRPLADLLDQDVAAQLLAAPSGAIVLQPLTGRSERFDAIAHRLGPFVVVELEPASAATLTGSQILLTLDAASVTFERATDLRDLGERAAAAFRKITGFDRVMVYRFLDDDAGVVMAEDRVADLGSFLNHHFPASDIPKQARALYIRNQVRVIPDVDYEPAGFRPASDLIAALDLSDVAVRGVSPIHIQYLKNMGVRASASISIVKDGILWGLIACHNRTPRQLPLEVRMACRTLAGGLARQIRAKEEAETYREQIHLRAAEDTVLARLSDAVSLDEFFSGIGEDLRRMLGADGFAAMQGRDLYTVGHCPERPDLLQIAGWVGARAATQPFNTHHLQERFGPAKHFADRASGLLAVTMSTESPTILMWFRAEMIEVVNWAGNPHKAAGSAADGGALTPRASFEAWSEEVRGRARPWTLAEIEAANRLKRNLYDSRQTHRLRELNRELSATLAEREGLLRQKDFLIKEINHRVQNSLSLVSAFLALQARATGDAALTGHLDEAQRRLSAVALVHRRLYNDDRVEIVDLARYLEELCHEMKVSMGRDWTDKINLDLAPTLISADRAVNVGLILTELVINANKYAYAGSSGPISIGLEQHRHRFRLIVADRGSGKSMARTGFGTRMLNAMVERLAGTLEETSNEPGLRVIVTAPIEPEPPTH